MIALAAQGLAQAPLTPRLSIGAFLLFCRIGGCLMLAPGFSSSQIPMQIRLFVALCGDAGADARAHRQGSRLCARRRSRR